MGKPFSKAIKANMNVPLILTLSVLPDIDLLLEPMLTHGGPTHSVLLYLVLAFPVILVWKKQTIPYLAALVSHPLLGDYLTRQFRAQGVQLFFPVASGWYKLGLQPPEMGFVYLELLLFMLSSLLMLRTKDAVTLLKHHPTNLLLTIPLATALLPSLIGFPLPVPSELILPHLILTVLLTLSILSDIRHTGSKLIHRKT